MGMQGELDELMPGPGKGAAVGGRIPEPCWLIVLGIGPSWPLTGRLPEGLSMLNKQPCPPRESPGDCRRWVVPPGELEVRLRSRRITM